MTLKILHQIVGKTRSNKIVYCAIEPQKTRTISEYFESSSFSKNDLFDAYAIFEYLSIRSLRRRDPMTTVYIEHSAEVRKLLSNIDFENEKLESKIFTVFDLRNFGEQLTNVEFKGF